MVQYKNLGRNSGIQSYEIGSDYIKLKYNGASRKYTFSYDKAGKSHVDRMKDLAERGYGLSSYIHDNVKFLFD